MTKRKAANGTSFDLSADERAALQDFAKTYKQARPNMARTAAIAQRVHQEMIAAPVLGIAESPKPHEFNQPPPEVWSVGHAKVNYVDHIETGHSQ